MNWYYAVDDEQVGPLTEAEFNALVQEGKIQSNTKVWREGMPEWAAYADLAYLPAPETGTVGFAPAQAAPAPAATVAPAPVTAATLSMAGYHKCIECGGTFPELEMISFENVWVCAACKPVFFQKLKEGVASTGTLKYAGFWIRFGAKVLDGIIIEVMSFCAGMVIGLAMRGAAPNTTGIIGALVGFLVAVCYVIFFNGRFGATPGKMALKLKIVRPDGEPIGYSRAFGRYFAELLSGLILWVGYMMAGWDEEKRALHDRIADTRVIHV
jgi:uncharacterized RDD family membrane protein YckC